MTTPIGEGFTAIYRVHRHPQDQGDQDVGDNVRTPKVRLVREIAKSEKGEPLTFRFCQAPANLTINLPQPKPGDSPAAKRMRQRSGAARKWR